MDASAVVGERGQRAPLSGGANDQLVRGGDLIVVRRARVRGRVARGGHDQHLHFEKCSVFRRPPTAHSRLLGAPFGCVEPPCAAWGSRQERPSLDVVSSFVEHAARVRFEQRGVLGEEAA